MDFSRYDILSVEDSEQNDKISSKILRKINIQLVFKIGLKGIERRNSTKSQFELSFNFEKF